MLDVWGRILFLFLYLFNFLYFEFVYIIVLWTSYSYSMQLCCDDMYAIVNKIIFLLQRWTEHLNYVKSAKARRNFSQVKRTKARLWNSRVINWLHKRAITYYYIIQVITILIIFNTFKLNKYEKLFSRKRPN